jgi:peptidoglycan/xylan/chitin deacetylase (PgdA/CDA1 family)
MLEYSVQDGSGNTATATRKVIVDYVKQVSGLPEMPDQTPTEPNGKVVYLTFDDGPSCYTSHLLDVLDKYEAKVSFFVVYADNAELLKRMDAAGHTVGMHSNTHDYGYIYSSEEAYFADLYAVQSKIEAAIGYKPMLLRFPGGSANTVSISYCGGIMTTLTQRVKELGFRYFDWNGDSRDVDGAESAKDVYINVTYGMHYTQNCIMLQHDIIGFSVEAVEDIVKWGLLNGYTFAPLTMDSPVCEFRVAN